jgi:hypothetical protein
MKNLSCSIGICVYNEEKNIGSLLDSLFTQKLKGVRITEIVVIASGTTDKTVTIVGQYARRRANIKILRERRRQGKASAVNKFIHAAKTDILVLVGGDIILTPSVIQELVGKFRMNDVGMTGARPVPLNNARGLTGRAAYLLWELHHRISLEHPKMGEVVAFRKIFKRIPPIAGADEASIEPLIRGQGYQIKYVPRAVVHNKAPAHLADFILQRRRNYSLHLAVKYEQRYEVSTYRITPILKAVAGVVRDDPSPLTIAAVIYIAGLEGLSRFLGWWDYRISKKRHTVWDVIESTKNPGL